ncbi:MAG: FtsH protease activity modulator HflK [Desulfovibrio sp.]|jgi:membrane protease subunit HflK|nr:FtsH protease activity modulator HflK [Desulfovibrio sp.]
MNWDWEKLQEKRQRQTPPPPQGEEPEDPFRGFQIGGFLSKYFSAGIPLGSVLIIALLLWLASGIFIVNPGEVGVITRFGQYERQVGDGPHYRLPYPLEYAEIINTQLLRTIIIGQSSEVAKLSQGKAEESSMFTGDENIVHMQFNVQYSISDARKYLFNVKEPDKTIAIAAEAAMREVIGRSNIDSILTAGRSEVQADAFGVLENILANYNIGVRIHAVQLLDVQPPSEVEAAFKDVASAREDKVRIINQAEAYRMEIVPVANGTAVSIVNGAQAYAQMVTQSAEGEAGRFTSMVKEFSRAKEITKKRMYLEAMQNILSSAGAQKFVLSKTAKGSVLPLLNLEQNAPLFDKSAKGSGESQGGGAR